MFVECRWLGPMQTRWGNVSMIFIITVLIRRSTYFTLNPKWPSGLLIVIKWRLKCSIKSNPISTLMKVDKKQKTACFGACNKSSLVPLIGFMFLLLSNSHWIFYGIQFIEKRVEEIVKWHTRWHSPPPLSSVAAISHESVVWKWVLTNFLIKI
jgi:hypothetical protein